MAEDKQTPEEEVEETVETPDVDTETTGCSPIDARNKDCRAEAKVAEAEDKYLRAHAEMQNMQTRFAKEQAQAVKYASQKLAKSVLPALDNLERALQVEADDAAAQQIKTESRWSTRRLHLPWKIMTSRPLGPKVNHLILTSTKQSNLYRLMRITQQIRLPRFFKRVMSWRIV